MKTQEIAVYREIQRNTEMAITAIDTISDKIYDDQLAMLISRQSLQYSQIHDQAVKELLDAKAELYHTGHLADMMRKILNHNEEAGEKPVALARRLLDFEEKNITHLKKYL